MIKKRNQDLEFLQTVEIDALRYGCMSRPMHTSYANRFNKTPRPQFQPADRIFGY